jgi:hypothetical protein
MSGTNVRRIFASLIVIAGLVATMFAPATVLAEDSGWQGDYYNNRNLEGTPVLTRSDAKLRFNWGEGRPAPELPAEDFSVRWTRKLDFEGGLYRFTFRADDGIRFYIDGKLVLDEWRIQGVTGFTVERPLTAGKHSLMLEYFEASGGAIVSLAWDRISSIPVVDPATGDDGWYGQYFNNRTLSGTPAMTRVDQNIHFNWGEGSPSWEINKEDFSVRWSRDIEFESGFYRFTFKTDDGVRFYIDGQLALEKWFDQGVTWYTLERPMTAGKHTLMLDYYEHSGGAIVSLDWSMISSVPTNPGEGSAGWYGQYFNNMTLSGTPVFERSDPVINFNWGHGSPAGPVNVDDFSVRWAQEIDVQGGIYRFIFKADDGIRFYLDGYPVLDQWRDQGITTFVMDLPISNGHHTLMLDYYEHGGGAIVSLQWYLITSVDLLQTGRIP